MIPAVRGAFYQHIVERDDGRYQIGLHDDASGPFETRAFPEAVAGRRAMRSPETRHPTTGADGRADRNLEGSWQNQNQTISKEGGTVMADGHHLTRASPTGKDLVAARLHREVRP